MKARRPNNTSTPAWERPPPPSGVPLSVGNPFNQAEYGLARYTDDEETNTDEDVDLQDPYDVSMADASDLPSPSDVPESVANLFQALKNNRKKDGKRNGKRKSGGGGQEQPSPKKTKESKEMRASPWYGDNNDRLLINERFNQIVEYCDTYFRDDSKRGIDYGIQTTVARTQLLSALEAIGLDDQIAKLEPVEDFRGTSNNYLKAPRFLDAQAGAVDRMASLRGNFGFNHYKQELGGGLNAAERKAQADTEVRDKNAQASSQRAIVGGASTNRPDIRTLLQQIGVSGQYTPFNDFEMLQNEAALPTKDITDWNKEPFYPIMAVGTDLSNGPRAELHRGNNAIIQRLNAEYDACREETNSQQLQDFAADLSERIDELKQDIAQFFADNIDEEVPIRTRVKEEKQRYLCTPAEIRDTTLLVFELRVLHAIRLEALSKLYLEEEITMIDLLRGVEERVQLWQLHERVWTEYDNFRWFNFKSLASMELVKQRINRRAILISTWDQDIQRIQNAIKSLEKNPDVIPALSINPTLEPTPQVPRSKMPQPKTQTPGPSGGLFGQSKIQAGGGISNPPQTSGGENVSEIPDGPKPADKIRLRDYRSFIRIRDQQQALIARTKEMNSKLDTGDPGNFQAIQLNNMDIMAKNQVVAAIDKVLADAANPDPYAENVFGASANGGYNAPSENYYYRDTLTIYPKTDIPAGITSLSGGPLPGERPRPTLTKVLVGAPADFGLPLPYDSDGEEVPVGPTPGPIKIRTGKGQNVAGTGQNVVGTRPDVASAGPVAGTGPDVVGKKQPTKPIQKVKTPASSSRTPLQHLDWSFEELMLRWSDWINDQPATLRVEGNYQKLQNIWQETTNDAYRREYGRVPGSAEPVRTTSLANQKPWTVLRLAADWEGFCSAVTRNKKNSFQEILQQSGRIFEKEWDDAGLNLSLNSKDGWTVDDFSTRSFKEFVDLSGLSNRRAAGAYIQALVGAQAARLQTTNQRWTSKETNNGLTYAARSGFLPKDSQAEGITQLWQAYLRAIVGLYVAGLRRVALKQTGTPPPDPQTKKSSDQQAKELADQRARELADQRARELADQRARELADQRARELADQRGREELADKRAKKQAETDREMQKLLELLDKKRADQGAKKLAGQEPKSRWQKIAEDEIRKVLEKEAKKQAERQARKLRKRQQRQARNDQSDQAPKRPTELPAPEQETDDVLGRLTGILRKSRPGFQGAGFEDLDKMTVDELREEFSYPKDQRKLEKMREALSGSGATPTQTGAGSTGPWSTSTNVNTVQVPSFPGTTADIPQDPYFPGILNTGKGSFRANTKKIFKGKSPSFLRRTKKSEGTAGDPSDPSQGDPTGAGQEQQPEVAVAEPDLEPIENSDGWRDLARLIRHYRLAHLSEQVLTQQQPAQQDDGSSGLAGDGSHGWPAPVWTERGAGKPGAYQVANL